jgi:hypothetical protein
MAYRGVVVHEQILMAVGKVLSLSTTIITTKKHYYYSIGNPEETDFVVYFLSTTTIPSKI